MAGQLHVFVSHSHKDNAFCLQIVQSLRGAGADVSLPNRTAPWWSALLYCPSGGEASAVSPNA